MIGSRIARTLSAMLLATLIALPAVAQEYKEAYNAGLAAAKAKNLPEALQKFTLAANGAKAAGDADVERRSNSVIGQIEYKFGLAQMRGENFDSALQHFENGIARYSTYAKNYLGRGLALKKMDRIDDAMAGFKQAMEVGNANRDRETARSAEGAIRDHFVYIASSSLARNGGKPGAGDISTAVAALAEMAEYVEADADAFYYTAEAHKARGEYGAAVAAADQALAVHRGSRTDKAKIFFVKGEALMQSGDAAGARTAFRSAAVGSYKASAEHYLETLGTR